MPPGNHIFFRFLLLLIAACSFSAGCAQQAGNIFDHITTKHGLSSNGVTGILQDREGFYWISTHNGLNRFDGTNFKTFYNHPFDSATLIHNDCLSLAEDRDENIWVGTMKGVSCFIKKEKRFKNYIFQHSKISADDANRISNLLKDGRGRIWVFSRMVMRLDPSDTKWTNVSDNLPFLNDEDFHSRKHAVYDPYRKGVWLSSSQQLFFLPDGKDTFYYKAHNPYKWKLFDVARPYLLDIDRKGRLWFHDVNQKNISLFSFTENKIVHVMPVLRGLQKIRTDEKNRLWMFYWVGPSAIYDESKKKADSSLFIHAYPKSLLNSTAVNLFIDKSLNYWIASSYGISILNSRQQFFTYYLLKDKAANEMEALKIKSLALASDQLLWLATTKGLYQCDLFNNQFRQLPLKPLKQPLFAIYNQNDSILWLSTATGVMRYHIQSKKIKSQLHLKSRLLFYRQDDNGNVWASSWENGIYCFNPKGNLIKHLSQAGASSSALVNTSVVAFEKGRKPGTFWIGYNGGKGFSFYDGGNNRFQHFKINLAGKNNHVSNTVNSIYEEPNGNVWLGTYGGGVYHYNFRTGRYRNFLQTDGLYSNYINSILPDKEGNLWITTTAGVNYLNATNLQIIPVPVDLDLLSNDFFPNAIAGKNDHFFFFKENIVVGLNSSLFHNMPAKSSDLRIISVKIFNEEIPFSPSMSKLSLSYKKNFLSFDFSLLKTNPDLSVHYAYKLEGFEKDWNNALNRTTVNYTNVPPGHYRFLLKAANQTGQWVYEARPVAITIRPPFWRTVWFWMLAGAGFFTSVYFFYRYRMNQLKRVLEVRDKISRDLHDEVGATLSGIALYSNLARRQLSLKKENETGNSLHVIEQSASEMVNKLNDIVWAVNPKYDSVESMVSRLQEYALQMSTVKNISCGFQISKEVFHLRMPMNYRKNIYLVCKEAINNAIKYSGATELHVQMNIKKEELHVKIRDNGVGFKETVMQKGNGLGNMKQRSAEINGQIYIEAPEGSGIEIHLLCPIP